tara:strand:- start:520 stop:870 length:351 start_codon:yes stop_codon:yes gene_type:complete
MKKIEKINFREVLEGLSRVKLMWVANYELIDFIRVDVLLDQHNDYTDYMCNLFDEDWDGDELEAMTIYPKLKSKFESLNDDELDGYFEQFAWEERTIDELMFLDKDARSNLLENLN